MNSIDGPGLESHAHRLAKQLLVGWFREAAAKVDGDRWQCCGINARPNRGGPFWGIFEEYPLTRSMLDYAATVWDEDEWPVQYKAVHGRLPEGATEHSDSEGSWINCGRPPTRDELISIRRPPAAILDIAIQHKGVICCGIEIYHRHEVHLQKARMLNSCGFPIFEIKADWLLAQVAQPERLKAVRFFGRDWSNFEVDVWRHAA